MSRIRRGSSSAPRSTIDASAGMIVKAMTSDASKAMTIVTATGANSFPSRPSRVNSGRKTIQIIRIPDATGLKTCPTAAMTAACVTASVRVPIPVLPNSASIFSTTTTAASTSMPSAMARPPRLIRLAVNPKYFIIRKVVRSASGNEIATTSAALNPPRNRTRITATSRAASINALSTVPVARETRSDRL